MLIPAISRGLVSEVRNSGTYALAKNIVVSELNGDGKEAPESISPATVADDVAFVDFGVVFAHEVLPIAARVLTKDQRVALAGFGGADLKTRSLTLLRKIGRASCRERVYVLV